MSTPLIKQIAEKLGVDVHQVERSLDALVSQIKSDAREKQESPIPGLGVFKADADSISFIPDESLHLFVNQRFAGLEPLDTNPQDSDAIDESSSEDASSVPVEDEQSMRGAENDSVRVEAPSSEDATDPDEDKADDILASPSEKAVPEDLSDDEEVAESQSEEDYDDIEDHDEEFWNAPPEGVDDHPLGPFVEDTFQDAEFEVEADAPEESSKLSESSFAEDQTECDNDDVEDEDLSAEDKELFDLLQFGVQPAAEEGVSPEGEEIAGVVPPVENSDKIFEEGTAEDSAIDDAGEFVLSADDTVPKPGAESAGTKSSRASARHRSRDQSGNRGLLILGVMALIAGAFIAYQLLKPGGQNSAGDSSVVQPIEQPADSSSVVEVAPDTVTTTVISTPAPRQIGGIDRSKGGWTMVVGSEVTRENAESTARSFLGLGYPVDILTGSSGGQPRFRVAVGQFEKESDVIEALRTLGDQLPAGSWRIRIRSSM